MTMPDDPSAAPARRRALVVDDNFAFRILAGTLLQRRGFAVHTADGAEAALAHLRDTAFDLLLIDIHMPGMDGTELCQIVRRQPGGRQPRILAYTSDGIAMNREAALAAGFDGLLMKPVCVPKLDMWLAGWFGSDQQTLPDLADLPLRDLARRLLDAESDDDDTAFLAVMREVESRGGAAPGDFRDLYLGEWRRSR